MVPRSPQRNDEDGGLTTLVGMATRTRAAKTRNVLRSEQVETAAFVARTLSTELGERLSTRGLACTRLAIEVETGGGDRIAARVNARRIGLQPVVASG